MTIEEVIKVFERRIKNCQTFINELQSQPESYNIEDAIAIFPKWLNNDPMTVNWELVYGPKLRELILKITKVLISKKWNKKKFQKLLAELAFVLGPRRYELIASAVTPCGCLNG